ncbi:MAG TPA: Asp-tRNA(Asn)/Glu-tRNA(Gln) amidotransferase subunit GatC [Bacteroidetes bacterium]|nr:Asp-tRNA(Asn)/Glu-tRNA(Gln) amidotransferase subunit GatC [Bacteroidota bacterium]
MAITENGIDKITKLAQLKPNRQEKQRLLADLNRILEHLEIIDKIDMEKSEEMQHQLSEQTPFRNNIAITGSTREEILFSVPQSYNGLIAVPKVADRS